MKSDIDNVPNEEETLTNDLIEFQKNFTRCFERSGYSIAMVARKLGIGYTSVRKYLLGKGKPSKIEIWQRICDLFNTTADELLGLHTCKSSSPSHPLLAAKSLPLLGKVSAGLGAYTGNFTTDRYNVPATWLKGNEDDYYVLKVTGDSMYPRIPDGSYTLIRKQQDIESGEIGIVIVDSEDGVIKKVNKHKDSIELVSFNPNYPPRIFEKEDMNRVKIVGLLKKVIVDF